LESEKCSIERARKKREEGDAGKAKNPAVGQDVV